MNRIRALQPWVRASKTPLVRQIQIRVVSVVLVARTPLVVLAVPAVPVVLLVRVELVLSSSMKISTEALLWADFFLCLALLITVAVKLAGFSPEFLLVELVGAVIVVTVLVEVVADSLTELLFKSILSWSGLGSSTSRLLFFLNLKVFLL